MTLRPVLIFLISLGLLGASQGQSAGCSHKNSPVKPTPTVPITQKSGFLNQTFVGYQGWFAMGGVGRMGTIHWANGVHPAPNQVTFELYPDTREYDSNDLGKTQLGELGDGTPSVLFSSDRDGVIDLHMKWMLQYGIDGMALQRFANEVIPGSRLSWRNSIALKIKDYAQAYGRFFYIQYDISGADPNTFIEDIKSDFTKYIDGSLDLIASPHYARFNGRPVVTLWGLGFLDRPGTADQAIDLIRWLQGKGIYVIGGVPFNWRLGNGDSKPGFMEAYKAFNMIQPWTVGRFSQIASGQAVANHMKADKVFCDQQGIDYQVVLFPGFSWSNFVGGVRNHIPRLGGQFLWSQALNAKQLGVSAFIAMFDEYDEGTAIAKAAENSSMIPKSQWFLTLDADGFNLSSDFYLRLSGAITKLLRGEIPETKSVPIPQRP